MEAEGNPSITAYVSSGSVFKNISFLKNADVFKVLYL